MYRAVIVTLSTLLCAALKPYRYISTDGPAGGTKDLAAQLGTHGTHASNDKPLMLPSYFLIDPNNT